MDLGTGEERTLASNRHADVYRVIVHPAKHAVEAVAFNKERIRWKVLDDSIKEDFKVIKRMRRGDFNVIDRDHADRTWLIDFTTDVGPVSFYTYDRKTKKAEFLFTNRKALEDVRLAKMEPVSFNACDGLTVHGYLTMPPGIKAKNLPTVLYVRRLPWSRSSWGYHGTAQWLANRGYAVLQVNFRGSRGYGKHFLNAANREWGGEMHCDLVDGVNWAVRKGIADPKRVAIYGGLYGGYSALVGLAFTPDVFCCGVDVSGPSNLITFLKALPPYLEPIEPLLWDRIGHPEKDAEFLKSRSALFSVDRIRKPLLIAQGANDPTVKRSESLQMVEALKAAGKTVEYVEYPDEGHGFTRPENRLDFYARAEKFLARHLGGRCQGPLTPDSPCLQPKPEAPPATPQLPK
jgi:dipeptidyl aminopeptidase/acylaminoacyl peptidase